MMSLLMVPMLVTVHPAASKRDSAEAASPLVVVLFMMTSGVAVAGGRAAVLVFVDEGAGADVLRCTVGDDGATVRVVVCGVGVAGAACELCGCLSAATATSRTTSPNRTMPREAARSRRDALSAVLIGRGFRGRCRDGGPSADAAGWRAAGAAA
jgi:hypothetical protein